MLGWGIVGVKHGFVLLCVVLLGIETTTHVSLHQAKNDLGFGALILHRGSLAEEAVVVNILPCGGTACGAARHGLGRRHMSSGAVARPPELSSSAASRCGITRSPQRHTWPSHLCTRPGPLLLWHGGTHGSSNMVFVGLLGEQRLSNRPQQPADLPLYSDFPMLHARSCASMSSLGSTSV